MGCTGQQRGDQGLPDVKTLRKTDPVVDQISSDALGEQPDEIGDDQAGDLEACQQDQGQDHPDDLLGRTPAWI